VALPSPPSKLASSSEPARRNYEVPSKDNLLYTSIDEPARRPALAAFF
jgi:hypothetical protein